MEAIIWTKNNCQWCDKAKTELINRGIAYEVRNINDGWWTKSDLLDMIPEAKTVPQIILDGIYVGGYTDLVNYK